ncbi:hypothetical protein [Robertkochia solimangrovi]|uniref:hypothetical protein n=1 Tax=Robertkochia solimangrovi TaxID=2213046 RepID=UPI00117CAA87|nr:hypothetical protein [Robertkochia solimangrovi]TRZ43128.1 hypothetical protein DMZ48_10565 [Robertkochia solimangrovi]
MTKEITLRVIRIVLATIFALILFPYLKNYFKEYSDQITLFFLFSSFIVGIFSIIISLLIEKVKNILLKNEQDSKNLLLENVHYTLRLILFTAFAISGLTIMSIYWVIILLTLAEIFGIFFNEEFERNKKMD